MTTEPGAIVRKAYAATIEPLDGERDVIATITTDAIDRDGEVIVPKGIELANYKVNPVVLWAHDKIGKPVGKALWVRLAPNSKALLARVRFATHPEAEDVYQLYRGGFLNAFSIGFLPHEFGRPTTEEKTLRPELAGADRIFRRVEMVEFSAVAVPANPEALVVAKGLVKSAAIRDAIELQPDSNEDPDAKKTLAAIAALGSARSLDQVVAAIESKALGRLSPARIESLTDQAAQRALDRTRGVV